jgi:hypothetical protein
MAKAHVKTGSSGGIRKKRLQKKRLPTPRERIRLEQRVALPSVPDISQKIPDISAIVASIPEMSAVDTVHVWRNALRTLADPLRAPRHVAAHVVLRAVQEEWERRQARLAIGQDGFPWPSTRAQGGDGTIDATKWLPEGMLKFLGYSVGSVNGKDVHERQKILSAVFDGPLPSVFPKPYMAEWSRPRSATRLRKLAESIAAFARNAKRREDISLEAAIEDWEDDLEFLHHQYYRGPFAFGWPRIL